MSNNNLNGPAFPVTFRSSVGGDPMDLFGNELIDGTENQYPGMSLLDYFMAHAPAEPQPWFKPTMPHPKPVAPSRPDDLTDEEKHDLSGYREDYLRVGDVRSNRLAAYLRELESHQVWMRAWLEDEAKQRFLQWPRAWADEMLKARKA